MRGTRIACAGAALTLGAGLGFPTAVTATPDSALADQYVPHVVGSHGTPDPEKATTEGTHSRNVTVALFLYPTNE